MLYEIGDIKTLKLVELYTGMMKSRLIEEKMLILLRQGKISKWFSKNFLIELRAISFMFLCCYHILTKN